MLQSQAVVIFLVGTFLISGLGFLLMALLPGAQSPEGLPGMPVWLIAIWSPSVMALLIASHHDQLFELGARLLAFRGLGAAWLIIAVPLLILIAGMISSWPRLDLSDITPRLLVMLLLLNLFLGPLGEELGWRGLLQPALEMRFGWLLATLLVAAIWAIWHAPLWAIASPQSEIPFAIFALHVLAYSLLMASAQSLAPHSLVPAVLLHLLFNVSSALALLTQLADTERWYTLSAFPYLAAAVVVALLARSMEEGQSGVLGSLPS